MIERHDAIIAGLGDILASDDLNAIDGAEQDRQEVAQRTCRQVAEHPDRRQGAKTGHQGESVGQAEPGGLQRAEDRGPDDHEGCVDDVDRSDDAGAPVDRGPGLNRREAGHGDDAAADREAGEIEADAPGDEV